MLKLEVDNIYPYLEKILPAYQRPVIFEVGAARGEDTELIKAISPNSDYYAFEPEPANLKLLKEKNLDIHIVETAIGSISGNVDFYQSSGWNPHAGDRQKYDHSLSGSIRKPKNHLSIAPWCEFKTKITVPIQTLDIFCSTNNIKYINFIWCDIQGAEQDMLSGASSILENTDFLYMEFSNDEMYDGQYTLDGLLKMIPSFEMIHKFHDDVLLHNKGKS